MKGKSEKIARKKAEELLSSVKMDNKDIAVDLLTAMYLYQFFIGRSEVDNEEVYEILNESREEVINALFIEFDLQYDGIKSNAAVEAYKRYAVQPPAVRGAVKGAVILALVKELTEDS
ncbi:hypothetical protein [Eubacterium oxidoreducens]|uniref:Uncharacterized protein n=1 Tax=Eubacterium oxidoreducens TaxID=1732 RepID=A0A1G6B316_EUBOX|nr:hypothetical protein [Eubacterium oxidoreducens]SDB14995.1 hypothetical protein SAMN02910417_01100 [Eubacterium oxidoreducens]